MRIVELYVANFGILSDLRIGFNEGVNSFLRDNGEGKSTLCEFITAMFYGMETTKANEKAFSPREHYLPFKGGSYGGSLVYEDGTGSAKKLCRIERTFDRVKKQQDSFKYYVNGEETPAESDIGYSLFGVGIETFKRLIYMTSFTLVPEGNSEIRGKIGNFAGSDADVYKNAKADIDKAKTELIPLKKVTGGKSVVPNLKAELEEEKLRRRVIENEKNELPEKYERRAKAILAVEQCKESLTGLERRRRMLEKWDEYERSAETLAGKQKKLKELTEEFPVGIPSETEIGNMADAAEKVKFNRGLLDIIGFGEADNKRLEEMSKMIVLAKVSSYGDDSSFGVDFTKVEADLSAVSDADAKLDALKESISGKENNSEYIRQKDVFEGREEEAASLSSDLKAHRKALEENEGDMLQEMIDIKMKQVKNEKAVRRNGRLGIVFLAAGAVIAAVGIMLLILTAGPLALSIGLIAGGAALASIGIGLLIAKAIGKRKKLETEGPLEKKALAAADALDARISAFGDYYVGGKRSLLFIDDLDSFSKTRSSIEAEKVELENINAGRIDIERKLLGLFGVFGIADRGLRNGTAALRELKNEFESLRDRKAKTENTLAAIRSSRAAVSSFRTVYMPDADVEELLERPENVRYDIKRAQELEKEIAADRDRLAGFRAGLGYDERPAPVDPSKEAEFAESLKVAESSLQEIEIEIRKAENLISGIGECEARIAEIQEKLDDANTFYSELDLAGRLIEQAEKDLNDRYIGPVSSKFEAYKKEFPDAIGENVKLRRDFTVEYESDGAVRKQDHLSTGQLACAALCENIALAESVLGEDKCFFVLDDPFTNLSDKNMGIVRKLLKKLSAKRQIVYLTCSAERMI
ncbi:MAG: AAA family ATPase [Clostridia bacterium]|nr:AAA family ATPase [Clostridia bacterium]